MTMLPLISCICVTANRRTWLAQSIKYFDWQVYPNREMVILEDGDEMNWELALGLNYHYIPGRMSIGEKRNLACRLARGEILCLWDDDDYYGPRRLSRQVAPLLEGRVDVTALHMSLTLDAAQGRLWQCLDAEHARLFTYDVRASTLMFPASYMHSGLRFEPGKGEDVQFLGELLKGGARLEKVRDPGCYICVRHAENITPAFECRPPEWAEVALNRYLLEYEQAFYSQFKGAAKHDISRG